MLRKEMRVASSRKNMTKKNAGALGGFTIMEVVLVLAIAGLIFLMVFIALPTLQRSQRDTQRRNDMARVSTKITDYQTNNGGKLPDDGSVPAAVDTDSVFTTCSSTGANATNNKSAACFIRNYMNGVNAAENEFTDPDGWYYGMNVSTLTSGQTNVVPAATADGNAFSHVVYIYKHAKCNGETSEYSSNSRDYTVMYKMEGSGTYCADNGS